MPALSSAAVPTVCDRPGFPAGLKVLLIENDFVLPEERLAESVALLKEAAYDVTSLQCSEAIARLERNEVELDVLLVSVRFDPADEDFNCGPHSEFLRKLALSEPVLVMSQTFDSKSLISAIEGGTIHTLRVPLDRRQVQKVWQQCVRKHVVTLRSGGVSERMQRHRSDASTAAAQNATADNAVAPAPSRKRESQHVEEPVRRTVRQRTAKVPLGSRWGSGVMAPRASAAQAALAASLPAMAPPCLPPIAAPFLAPTSKAPARPAPLGGKASSELPWALLGDSTDALLSLLPPGPAGPHDTHGQDGLDGPEGLSLLSCVDALDALLPWDNSLLGGSFHAQLCGAADAAAAVARPAPLLLQRGGRESAPPSLASPSPSSVLSEQATERFSIFLSDSADSLRGGQGPLGLRLRKSASLASLVEESLARGGKELPFAV